jgi:hypothetical protein
VTLAYAEGWWWKDRPRIRAQLGNRVVLDCRSGPFKAGPVVVVIVAKSVAECLGDARNSSPEAKLLEGWMVRNGSRDRVEQVKKMLETAEDGWACAKSLASKDSKVVIACQGVANDVVEKLKN